MAGLALLAVISMAMNAWQYTKATDTQAARLEATLLRPSRTPGAPARDASLKELSFAQQTSNVLGITTELAHPLIQRIERGEATDTVVIDMRESAEAEMGGIPQSTHVRFPDFDAQDPRFRNKKLLLFCHNGNRSSETCQSLAARGIDCRFIVGGLEKWVVESRPLSGTTHRTLDQLRSIPSYPTQRVLFDTAHVRKLVAEQSAIFVDVRYPGDFAAGHLPGAHNIPLRRLPTVELEAQLRSLPKQPIIAACYDRRSCFMSEVLGLELIRAGHDFRGRYTLPWEYFIPASRPPHVDAWIAAQQLGTWDRAGQYLTAALLWMTDVIGLPLAILVLALISRLIVLPFSLKAEQDQVRSAAISGKVAELRQRLANNSFALSRAMRALYRQQGLTPGRNLIALLFLPVMALALSAVQSASASRPSPFYWLPSLAERDPTLALPIAFGALVSFYLHLIASGSRRNLMMIWALGFPLLVLTGALLSAGADIYIVASATLLLTQRALVAASRTSWTGRLQGWMPRPAVVTLSRSDLTEACGNKAHRLAVLAAAGVPVPSGVVLTSRYLESYARLTPRRQRRSLDRIWQRIGAQKLAVRSSASAEDGAANSFAGVFDSELDVGRHDLQDAVAQVLASFTSEKAGSYGCQAGAANILVQTMVDAEFAGVLFTQHPAAPGQVLVELVAGTADKLVSGAISSEAYRFGRLTLEPQQDVVAPIDLKPLLLIGQKAEEMFGKPQDIEWTYRGGEYQIVQSRDITAGAADSDATVAIATEWRQLIDRAKSGKLDDVVFAQSELSELLPRPTPLSLAITASCWQSGGSIDLACRRLGLDYHFDEDAPSPLLTVFGRLYIDKIVEAGRVRPQSRAATRRIAKQADRIEQAFRNEFLPEFTATIRLLEAVDFECLDLADLRQEVTRLHADYTANTHLEVDTINIAAGVLFEIARQTALEEGRDPAACLTQLLPTAMGCVIAEAAHAPALKRIQLLLKGMGHRALFDYELAEPRFSEAPQLLLQMHGHDAPVAVGTASAAHERQRTAFSPALRSAIDNASRFQALKEDAKHHSLRQFAVLRKAILALGRRLELGDLVYFLTIEELFQADHTNAQKLVVLAESRRKIRSVLLAQPMLGPNLNWSDLEAASAVATGNETSGASQSRGIRVSGTTIVEARVCRATDAEAESGAPIASFKEGDIIVSSMIHPAWLPQIRQSAGLVSEVGGWLSHMAIVARELQIPMVVRTTGLSVISAGSRVRIEADGQIGILEPMDVICVPRQEAAE